jgi:hypothetical protein
MPTHQLQKLRPIHDALIDLLLASPRITQAELGLQLGYTSVGIGIIMRSDVFREKLAERRIETIDPVIRATFEEKLNALAEISAERLMTRTQLGLVSDKDMLASADLGARVRGYGARQAQSITFVAVVPERSRDSAAWVEGHAPQAKPPLTITPEGSSE